MSVKTLEKITGTLKAKYPASKEWDSSEFDWIRGLPPASKGVIGRYVGYALLQHYGLTVTAYKYELRINGQGVLVRMGTKWVGNVLKFQNIRNNPFDHVLCIGLYPKSAYAWLVPKDEIWKDGVVRDDRDGVKKQHKGADAWISVDPKKVQDWLEPYGGTIDEMIKVAKTNL